MNDTDDMRDASSVITEATKDIIPELMADFEVRRARIYEMLGSQCSYAKTKVLIRRIAEHSKDGARLIRADLEAMWDEIFGPETDSVTNAEMNRELEEAVQARLDDASPAERLKEDREAVSVLNRDIESIERCASIGGEVVPIRTQMKEAVVNKRSRNGNSK